MRSSPVFRIPRRLTRTAGRPVARSGSIVVTIVALVLQTLVIGVLAVASPAAAAGAPSGAVDAAAGFPTWYQDSAGNRVEPCIDPNDANCVLAASASYDPTQPTVFPTNYPDEFFYSLADSDLIPTAGCAGTAPGRASVRIAVEGAFLNGAAKPGEQMTFGRIRVKVTSGLCPNTTYHFKHPFGTETFTTNAAGGVPANVGTDDVGCLGFVPPARCDFAAADGSRVFGSATNGFLRWDGTAPAAPSGYLGDGATLHAITGGNGGFNSFAILDSNNNDLGLSTDQFTVAGKLAGSLAANPSPLDFGGQTVATTSPAQTVKVTNLDSSSVTVGATTLTGGAAANFAASPGATSPCAVGTVLTRDQSCNVAVTFTPSVAGRVSSTVEVVSTGGYRSPLRVTVTGRGVNAGDAPSIELTPNPMSFLDTRVRTVSATKTLSIGNTGASPLKVNKVFLDSSQGADATQFQITRDACTGTFVDPGAACAVDVIFAPSVSGAKATSLRIESNDNGSPHFVPVSGTATGGVAAVSPGNDPDNGFPNWYRDENGVKLSQCLDPNDPNCTVLADPFFDPAQAVQFPTNFPGEFFYTVADSDKIITPGCNGSAPGKAFMRSAIEGTFLNGGPVDKEQMTFGRIRFSVTGGLCPNTDYTFTYPYGQETFTTNANGGVARARATDDVGCTPVPPDVPCDFSAALSSRVFGGFLRWDPSVAPAAPAGYIGDAATLHKIVGAPFKVGGTPANFFQIAKTDGTVIGQTDQFSVMGKLRGPLEADTDPLELASTPVGSTSSTKTVTYTNTGIAPLTVNSLAISGVDAGDFTLAGGTCAAALILSVGDTCTAQVSFSPTATGDRDANIVVRHSGLNDPLSVHLHGIGGAVGSSAAISFVPRSVAFAPLHTGDVSSPWSVTISNVGGTLPLDVNNLAISGPGAASFSIDPNTDTCSGTHVAGGASCTIDVIFSPTSAGAKTANLVVTDNAPGGTHSLALSGTGTDAAPAVSVTNDQDNGYPQWYGDRTNTRVAPCLDPADANCVLLGDAGFNPANPVSFPSNFPGEFFYSLADSDVMTTPGCGTQSAPGNAIVRTALEGSFANGVPAANDQTTFGRLRVTVVSGLCPNASYMLVTPWGTLPIQANATGGIARNAATEDTGCNPVAPATCDFSAALGSRIAKSFPRWDPAFAPAPPAGYLGNPVALHKIVGGTYIPPNASSPVNYVAITDLAGNELVRTDKFLVSGKIAGPLVTDKNSVDVGHANVGTPGAVSTVNVTNVATTATTISSVTLGGPNANQFTISGGSCAAGTAVQSDAQCTVQVRLSATTAGVKNATLTVTPATGPAVVVKLTGTADPSAQPAITVTPGVLAYGTVTAPATGSLSTTVRNTGTAPLVISPLTITGANAGDFSVTSAPCGSIPAGTTCLITVRFAPTATGARTATLNIPHNAQGGLSQVSLTGTGAGSTFTITPNPLTFGTVTRNTTKTQSVTVKNSGTIAFRITTATISGAQAANFAVTNATGCTSAALAPGKTCSITVSLTPTAVTTYTAALVVGGDATSVPPTVSTSLSGTGK